MKITAEHEAALARVMAQMPLSKRREVAADIELLKEAVGSTDDFTSDRRALRWAAGSEARAKFEAERAKKKEEKRIYKVQWRGHDPVMCNIEEAAAAAKKKVSSLHTYLAKGGGSAHFNIEDEILTITRLKE